MAAKDTKPAKEKKAAAAPLHPPYLQMITEAISSLKERNGSSQQAIAKLLDEKYKSQLPPNFRKMLSVQLKRFAKSEKLFKVKNSFKISAHVKKPASAPAGAKKNVAAPATNAASKAAVAKNAVTKKSADGAKGTKVTAKKKTAAAPAKAKVGKKVKAEGAKKGSSGAVTKMVGVTPKKSLKAIKSPPKAKKRVAKSIKSASKPAAKKART